MHEPSTSLADQSRLDVPKSDRPELTEEQIRFAEVLGRLLADRWRENGSHTHQTDRSRE